jgi:pantoate kinase
MRGLMKKVYAFSPGHITGFFEICDSPLDPLDKGSRGAGFSISHGVKTEVSLGKAGANSHLIYFGTQLVKDAGVSKRTIDLFLRKTGTTNRFFTIRHDIEVPPGAGFGSSGAGALGLALAINALLDAGLSRIECAQIAHIAEVESKTGLGTVAGEITGGFEIRTEPGAPGIGKIDRIPLDQHYMSVTLTFGPLPTKKYLESKSMNENINRFASSLVGRLHANPSVANFLDLSREFAENTGLLPSDIINILSVLDRHGIQASMPMFGHGIFTLIREHKLSEVRDILGEFQHEGTLLVSEIDGNGAHIIDET